MPTRSALNSWCFDQASAQAIHGPSMYIVALPPRLAGVGIHVYGPLFSLSMLPSQSITIAVAATDGGAADRASAIIASRGSAGAVTAAGSVAAGSAASCR